MNIALIIGCSNHADPDIANLQFADKDAIDFTNHVSQQCDVGIDDISLLTTDQSQEFKKPTRSNILRHLSLLKQKSAGAKINRLFFFFSGHGYTALKTEKEYLVCSDTVASILEETSLEFDKIIAFIRQLHPAVGIFFVDACRAYIEGGKTLDKTIHSFTIPSIDIPAIAFFNSCSPGEKSYEEKQIKNGIFSHCLCRGLSDEGRCVTIADMNKFLSREIPLLSLRFAKPIQHVFTRIEPLDTQDAVIVSQNRVSTWKKRLSISNDLSKIPKKVEHPYIPDKVPLAALDFGTSFSTISILNLESKPYQIPCDSGQKMIPTVITFQKTGDYVVGWDAVELAKSDKTFSIQNIKRLIGSDDYVHIHGQKVSTLEVVSLIIMSIKKRAEALLDCELPSILSSIPANFTIGQANFLARACKNAGFNVYRLIGEPCAASILLFNDPDFIDFIQKSKQIRGHEATILVIDLGGGTLDISILDYGDGVFEVKSVVGNNCLGGIDYNARINSYIFEQLSKILSFDNFEIPLFLTQRINDGIERAKIDLGNQEMSQVVVPNIEVDDNGLQTKTVELSRELFRNLTKDLNDEISHCISESLQRARVKSDNIDIVLLAGQGAKIFTVSEILHKIFPGALYITKYQESTVSQGLSMYTGVLTDVPSCRNLLLLDTN